MPIPKNHPFYIKPVKEQKKIQAYIGLGAFAIVSLAILLAFLTGVYLIPLLVFPVTLSIIAPFIDVPTLVKSGQLTYHSSLFLSEKPRKGVIKVHGGTLFDYVFVLDRNMNGKQRTRFILQQYLEGLLHLLECQSEDIDKELMIRATSYIVNDKTAKRLGFQKIKTDGIQRLILFYNYLNVLLSLSLVKGKLTFPSLSQTRTFEASVAELISRKDHIRALNEKLKSQ